MLAIDPENVASLYNKMLALGALGRNEEFAEVRELYEFHKDDERAQAVASPYKRIHAMDNREAQLLHEHELHVVRGSSSAGSPGATSSHLPGERYMKPQVIRIRPTPVSEQSINRTS